jgi:hypothetical protein
VYFKVLRVHIVLSEFEHDYVKNNHAQAKLLEDCTLVQEVIKNSPRSHSTFFSLLPNAFKHVCYAAGSACSQTVCQLLQV